MDQITFLMKKTQHFLNYIHIMGHDSQFQVLIHYFYKFKMNCSLMKPVNLMLNGQRVTCQLPEVLGTGTSPGKLQAVERCTAWSRDAQYRETRKTNLFSRYWSHCTDEGTSLFSRQKRMTWYT